MPGTTPALPAGANLGRSFEKGVNIVSGGAPLSARRISDVNCAVTTITQPAQSYDDFGAPNDDKTSESWVLTFSILVNRLSSGFYLPEVEALKALTEPDVIGNAAVGTFQWFDKPYDGTPHPEDAYEGDGTVALTRNNVAADGATETWGVTVTGKGKRRKITNPWAGWTPASAVINSVTPAAAGTGELVRIDGVNFTGATGITFEAIAADDFTVIGAGTISAVLPTDDAGEVDVIVTTPAGPSAPFPYTRGA